MNIYLQRMQDAIAEATHDMNASQLARHREGKWSTAEILEHLDHTYRSTATALRKCLDAGQPTARRPTFAQRLAVGIVVGAGYMPGGRKAPEYAVPRGLPPDEVLRNLPAHIADMDKVLAECERRFGAYRKLANHFVLGPLTAQEWCKFHWIHTRHHIRQIARLITAAPLGNQPLPRPRSCSSEYFVPRHTTPPCHIVDAIERNSA